VKAHFSAEIENVVRLDRRARFVLRGATTMQKPNDTKPFLRLVADSRGANMVEYILLVGVVALIALAGFRTFGYSVRAKIDEQAGSVGGINGQGK
jgi:pilus assembly protein Flp/PilA